MTSTRIGEGVRFRWTHVDGVEGSSPMWTSTKGGSGPCGLLWTGWRGSKTWFFVDVINGWPVRQNNRTCKDRLIPAKKEIKFKMQTVTKQESKWRQAYNNVEDSRNSQPENTQLLTQKLLANKTRHSLYEISDTTLLLEDTSSEINEASKTLPRCALAQFADHPLN